MDVLHGVPVPDPYRWLEDGESAEVQAWMSEQDAFARRSLARLPRRAALLERFRELYTVEAVGTPVIRGNRYFYLRTRPDREKAVLCWREGESGEERVLLDPQMWTVDGTTSLGEWSPSWDGRRVAFARKANAADDAVLHVVEVDTGAVSASDVIPGARYATPDWSADGEGFYYEWLPTDPEIPADRLSGFAEIRFHALGTDPASDALVHPSTGDPERFLSAWMGGDGRYLFVDISHGWSANELRVRDLRAGGAEFRPLVAGGDARYGVTAWRDELYIWTDEGAPRGRVMKTSAARPGRADWVEIVPEDPTAILEAVSLVGGHLALSYLRDAASELRVVTLGGTPLRTVALPSLGSVSMVAGLPDRDDAYFQFSSFTLPRQVYRTSVRSGDVRPWVEVDLPIDPSPYVVEQVRYRSKDGTVVPMFIVRRRDAQPDGTNPVILNGYGGFGYSMPAAFRATVYPWLEAGGIYALANVRGGGEYGRAWHEAGRGADKQNVFDDFVAAGEHLIAAGWTRPDRLGILGGSNGGLLVAAAMTQRPELWGAVVCQVPLLDMVRYHRFGGGRLWVPEYGSADDPAQLPALLAYSPYHRVRAGTEYPALLVTTADHDDRVDPLHARKFVAAVQNATASGRSTLLRIERNAGHGGADQVSRSIESSTDIYAFLLAELQVSE